MNLTNFVKSIQHFSLEAVGTNQGTCKHKLDLISNSQKLCKNQPIGLRLVVLKKLLPFCVQYTETFYELFADGE